MAGIHPSAASASPFRLPSPATGNSRIQSSYLPSSFPPRERRTNHLRKKILKTLETKPYPQFPQKIQTFSVEETVNQQQQQTVESVTDSVGFIDGIMSQFSNKSFAKIGLYLVGAFVFQTVCAVLIFGSNDLFGDDENLDSDSSDGYYSKKKSKPKLNSNMLLSETKDDGTVSVDEVEMSNRIVEIQEMARRARLQEKMEGKRNGLGEDEEEDDGIEASVKKKEVGDRLMKMKKSLEGEYHNPAVKDLRKRGDVGENGGGDLLMFKKKYKYKSPSVDSGDKPKGFNGSVVNGVSVDDGTMQTDKENDVDSKEQEPRATETESIDGTSKVSKYDKQTSKAEKSGKSNSPETRKPRGFGKESNDTTTTTTHDDFNKNGNLKGKKGGNKKSARDLENKFSTQTDFWWTSLPYVMAVQMQSGVDGEESSGLFILRNPYGLHHTVAFEDRSDATNFCYLLESFFEDLPNFSTNIIPIPTNELEEEVKSQKMKVVVVKKRQLKLYVDQPLEDVESALRTLIEQQN